MRTKILVKINRAFRLILSFICVCKRPFKNKMEAVQCSIQFFEDLDMQVPMSI